MLMYHQLKTKVQTSVFNYVLKQVAGSYDILSGQLGHSKRHFDDPEYLEYYMLNWPCIADFFCTGNDGVIH